MTQDAEPSAAATSTDEPRHRSPEGSGDTSRESSAPSEQDPPRPGRGRGGRVDRGGTVDRGGRRRRNGRGGPAGRGGRGDGPGGGSAEDEDRGERGTGGRADPETETETRTGPGRGTDTGTTAGTETDPGTVSTALSAAGPGRNALLDAGSPGETARRPRARTPLGASAARTPTAKGVAGGRSVVGSTAAGASGPRGATGSDAPEASAGSGESVDALRHRTGTSSASGTLGNGGWTPGRPVNAWATPVAAGHDSSLPLPLDAGMDRISTRIYTLGVRTPGMTRSQIVAAGIPADAIDPAVDHLTQNGLLRPTGHDAWEAIPPELALSSLASSYEARALYLRDAAEDLTNEYHRIRLAAAEQSPGLTVLRNTDELAAAVQGVTGAATQEIWAALDDSPRAAHLFGTDLDRHRQRLLTRAGTPLRRRTTLDGQMLRHPRAGEVLRARAEAGEENRFLADLPFSIVGADDHSAVVDLTSFDTSGAGSMLVHDRRLVLALRRLCETWWQLASPMAWDAIGEVDRDSAFILSMLAAGATDATMAAQTGLSQRTIERRVRVLMTRLGASTRFQAGVLATRRGWI